MSRPSFCIEHHVGGRVVGVLWEFAVVLTSLLVIPGICASVVVHLLALIPPAVILSLPFVAIGLVSIAFGIVWSFRRHLAEHS